MSVRFSVILISTAEEPLASLCPVPPPPASLPAAPRVCMVTHSLYDLSSSFWLIAYDLDFPVRKSKWEGCRKAPYWTRSAGTAYFCFRWSLLGTHSFVRWRSEQWKGINPASQDLVITKGYWEERKRGLCWLQWRKLSTWMAHLEDWWGYSIWLEGNEKLICCFISPPSSIYSYRFPNIK